MPRSTARRGSCFFVTNIRFPLSRPHRERGAADDAEHQRREAIVVGLRLAEYPTNDGHVVMLQAAAEGIREQLLRDGAGEELRLGEQRLAQLCDTVDGAAVG